MNLKTLIKKYKDTLTRLVIHTRASYTTKKQLLINLYSVKNAHERWNAKDIINIRGELNPAHVFAKLFKESYLLTLKETKLYDFVDQ